MARLLLLVSLLAGCVGSSVGVGVQRIVDGDTLVTDDGTTLRLFGIDTPERGECGFEEGTKALRRYVGDGPIRWSPPRPNRGDRGGAMDKYGRSIAEVFVDGRSINLAMLEAGFARSTWFSARVDSYRAAEARARREGSGLWRQCPDF
ncbi:MAG: thermonuclease family protein [Myxococcota bacterium]